MLQNEFKIMRIIDCYLTDEEQSAISNYLLYGLIAENLTQIEAKRRLEYNKQINKMVPNTALTYRTFNQKNDIICPIEVFLNNFSNILENAKLRPENQDLLKRLETGISECGASCPCPAECN